MRRQASGPDFRNDYKGENPPKKLMRMSFWLLVQQLLGSRRFRAGPHLVLPSREAGDVSVLLAMDVPIENIVAVEWHPREAALARAKFPGLVVAETDIGGYIRSTSKEFASVFLDFCSWATQDNLGHLAEAAKRIMQPDSLIACNFQVGREKLRMRSAVRRMRREVAAQLMHVRRPDLEDMESYFSRSFAIQQELARLTAGLDVQLDARFFYSSRYGGKAGHPWCGHLFRVNPMKKRETEPQCYHFVTDDAALRVTALDLERRTKRAALLLNIPQSSISAWKAHATRGTYREK